MTRKKVALARDSRSGQLLCNGILSKCPHGSRLKQQVKSIFHLSTVQQSRGVSRCIAKESERSTKKSSQPGVGLMMQCWNPIGFCSSPPYSYSWLAPNCQEARSLSGHVVGLQILLSIIKRWRREKFGAPHRALPSSGLDLGARYGRVDIRSCEHTQRIKYLCRGNGSLKCHPIRTNVRSRLIVSR